MTRIRLAALALVLLPLGAAALERPVDRPTRRKAERRLARLEERLRWTQAEGPRGEASLDLARRNADFARKLLKVNNVRAAVLLAASAERLVSEAEAPAVETGEVRP